MPNDNRARAPSVNMATDIRFLTIRAFASCARRAHEAMNKTKDGRTEPTKRVNKLSGPDGNDSNPTNSDAFYRSQSSSWLSGSTRRIQATAYKRQSITQYTISLAFSSCKTPRKYVFDVTSVGQRSLPWTCNSVKVEIKFPLECKLRFPSAHLMLRQMHLTKKCKSIWKCRG